MYKNFRLQILFALFIALLIGMNLLGSKIINLFWIPASVAIFIVPLTFLITDIVEDVYGKEVIKKFIILGVFTLSIIFIFSAIFVLLEPHERFSNDDAYKTIFWGSLRITFASIFAFVLAQVHDAYTFELIKKRTQGRALWLRNNVSTIFSQLIDSSVFMFMAFYMITPKFTIGFIVSLIIPYYLFKVLFAILDTPLVYLWVKWLKNWEEK